MTTSDTYERLHSVGGDRVASPLAGGDLSAELTWLVERVCQNNLPWVVVASSALTAWQERDPTGWEKVSGWLDAKGVAIVRI